MATYSKDLGLLGKGSHGCVRKVEDLVENRIIALKIVKRIKPDGSLNINLEEELEMLRTIESLKQHDYFLRYYGYKCTSVKLGIMLEYFHGEDLSNIIEKDVSISRVFIIKVFIIVSEALEILHSNGIIHRDVKPANIMISNSIPRGDDCRITSYQGLVKLIDFGFTTRNSKCVIDKKGSPLYIAPEYYLEGYVANYSDDVWSLGVSLYETLFGKVPIPADNINELIVKLTKFQIEWKDILFDEDDFLFRQIFIPKTNRITAGEVASSLRAVLPFA